jgi:hypothetical protein
MLRLLFGQKRVGVKGGWRILYNAELRDLYSSPRIIRIIKSRVIRLTGHVARMEPKKNACMLFVAEPEEKRPLG